MSLSARAIALQGFALTPIAIAVQGLIAQTTEPPAPEQKPKIHTLTSGRRNKRRALRKEQWLIDLERQLQQRSAAAAITTQLLANLAATAAATTATKARSRSLREREIPVLCG